jgi:hypothetical protein
MQEPWRGTLCSVRADEHYLLTTGYVPYWGEYPGPHVPAPLQIGCVHETDIRERAVDDSTNLSFLEKTLHATWRVMPGNSANALPSKPRLRILRASSAHRRTLDTLLGLLCESFEGQPAVAGRIASFPAIS